MVLSAPDVARPAFAVGKSPFHCKGVAYRNFLEYLDDTIPGKRAAFLEALTDPALREILTQPLLPSSWYDALPMVTLCGQAAHVVRQPPLRYSRALARFGVQRDVRGVYKFLLRLASAEGLLERSAATVAQYYDFVSRTVAPETKSSYIVTDSGIPAWSAPYYMSISEGFLDELLPMTGARDVRQHWDPPEPAGNTSGVPVVRLRRFIRWG
jgi:hypothetical protein